MILSLPTLPPSVNRARKIHKRGDKRFIGSTDEYRAWIEESSLRVMAQRRGGECIAGAFRVEFTLTRPDKRRRDADNLLKASLDALTKGGAIADDSNAQRIEIAWIEDGPPGMSIVITPVSDLRPSSIGRRAA